MNDFEPAFPHLPSEMSQGHPGMSLRDYFASHADPIGYTEIYELAGSPKMPLPPGWREENFDKQAQAAEWVKGISADEKYRLYAEARYKIADAMMKARKTP